MKTQGEIEAAICEGISRFEQEYMGRGPKKTQAHLLGDLLVDRLQGLLTTAGQQLAKPPATKGRDLLKQVRTHLIESAKPLLQVPVQDSTGVHYLHSGGKLLNDIDHPLTQRPGRIGLPAPRH